MTKKHIGDVNEMIQSEWESKFDEKFMMSLLPLLPMIPNKNVPYEIKDFIRSLLSRQLDQVEREVIELKIIEPPKDVEKLKEKRQAFIAGQMNILLRQHDILSAIREGGER